MNTPLKIIRAKKIVNIWDIFTIKIGSSVVQGIRKWRMWEAIKPSYGSQDTHAEEGTKKHEN